MLRFVIMLIGHHPKSSLRCINYSLRPKHLSYMIMSVCCKLLQALYKEDTGLAFLLGEHVT